MRKMVVLVTLLSAGCARSASPSGRADLQMVAVQDGGGVLPDGRLLVVWFPFEENGVEPVIAYEAEVEAGSSEVAIPLDGIAVPHEAVLTCERPCDDPAACACAEQSGYRFGTAAVALWRDGEGAPPLERDDLLGGGWVLIGYSEQDTPADAAPWLGTIFPEGLRAGVSAYAVADSDDRKFSTYRPTDETTFELRICAEPGDDCDPFPFD